MNAALFAYAFIVTDGGPVNASLFYMLYLYRNAFQFFQMGYASALAVVLFLIIFQRFFVEGIATTRIKR